MRQLSTFWVVIFLVSVSLQNCAPEPGPAVEEAATTEADVEAVKRVREQAVAAINAGDADAVAALATDDIVWMPQDKPTSIGKEAFRLYWVALFEQFVFDRTLSHDEVIVAGDWAPALRGSIVVAILRLTMAWATWRALSVETCA